MPESPEVRYAEREQQYARLRDEQRRKSAVLARLRLATFLPAMATLVWWLGFHGGIPAFVLTVVLLLAFGALVVMHARVEERAERFEALRTVNVRGTARLKRDWDALPSAPAPDGTSTEGHPYAADLDVFGRASLFQWIGPGATEYGHRILATWLLSPASAPEITSRQAALAELAPLDGWREQLASFGVLAAAQRPDSIAAFRRWAERPGPALRRSADHQGSGVLHRGIPVDLRGPALQRCDAQQSLGHSAACRHRAFVCDRLGGDTRL